jgi:V/A-type H+-transporting ATPase subunit D
MIGGKQELPQQVIEGIKPTRMELLKLKQRVKLAERGRDLLKEKRDALVMEFFDVMRLVMDARTAVNTSVLKANRALSVCYSAMGTQETRQIATYLGREMEVAMGSKNIMGVVVPTLEVESAKRQLADRGYTFVGGSTRLDEAAATFEDSLNAIMNLASAEERARRVASELEKTKRRVSALDNVIVPRLQGSIRMIEDKLEELERENFSRLKKIKAILVAREGS